MSAGHAAYDVFRWVRPLHRAAEHVVATSLEGTPVGLGGRALLERLDDVGPQTVPQLAAWLGVSRQAVQKVVDDAIARGILATRPNPRHRRSHLVEATTDGAALFRDLHERELDDLTTLTRGIPEEDLRTAARVLEQLTTALHSR